MPLVKINQRGLFHFATINCHGATGMEAAAWWRAERAGHIAS